MEIRDRRVFFNRFPESQHSENNLADISKRFGPSPLLSPYYPSCPTGQRNLNDPTITRFFSACYLQIRKNGGKARISAELEICVIRREKDALGKQKSSGRNDPSPSQAHRIFSGYLPVLEWRIVSQTISGTFADPQRVFLDYLAYFSANLQA